MKSFKDHITERLAIEDNPNTFTPPPWSGKRSRADVAFEKRQATRYGGVMARLAAKALADAERRAKAPLRPPFPWSGKAMSWGARPVPGWWHPQREWFSFDVLDGYHLTQIVRAPARFGVSRSDLEAAAEREAAQRNAEYKRGNGELWYDHEGTEHPWTGERVLGSIAKKDIDLSYEIQRLAYDRGWVKVYGGNRPHTEGISRLSLKTALREIANIRGGDTEVEVVFVGFKPRTDRQKYMRAEQWSSL